MAGPGVLTQFRNLRSRLRRYAHGSTRQRAVGVLAVWPSDTESNLEPRVARLRGLTIGRDVVEAQRVLWLVVAMEDLGGKIEAIRPDDCACLGIDSNLGEVVGVLKGRDHRAHLAGDVLNVANHPVVKQQPHDVRTEDGDADDVRKGTVWTHGNGSIVPGSPPLARCHASTSSPRWSSTQSRTSPACRAVRLPTVIIPVLTSTTARCAAAQAWTCGGPWSPMYM